MNGTLQLVCLACVAAMACPARATNYVAGAGGDWNNNGTWTSTPPGGTYPQFPGDTAVIQPGTVTVPNAYTPFPSNQSIEVSGSGSVLQFGTDGAGDWTVPSLVTLKNAPSSGPRLHN